MTQTSTDGRPAGVVRLASFPVRLFAAAERQWEELLREYTLRGLGGAAQSYSGDEIGRARQCLRAVVDAAALAAAQPGGVERDSVPLVVSDPGAFPILQGLLDDAQYLVRTGELLTLRSLPEVIALRDWLCREVVEQTAGADPKAWVLRVGQDEAYDTAAPRWDRTLTPPPGTAWLVGDDQNRILAASPTALSLLGWDEDDLVGRRLLTVIPHHLREAHIAGFTRSTTTGEAPLLSQPLPLLALARDGSHIPVALSLSRHPAAAGRHVYLALMDLREA